MVDGVLASDPQKVVLLDDCSAQLGVLAQKLFGLHGEDFGDLLCLFPVKFDCEVAGLLTEESLLVLVLLNFTGEDLLPFLDLVV